MRHLRAALGWLADAAATAGWFARHWRSRDRLTLAEEWGLRRLERWLRGRRAEDPDVWSESTGDGK